MASKGIKIRKVIYLELFIIDYNILVCYTPNDHTRVLSKGFPMLKNFFTLQIQKRSLISILIIIFLAGLTLSCTSSGDTQNRDSIDTAPEKQTIPAAGGTLDFDNGVQMIFPPEAVSEDTDITIELLQNSDIKEILDRGNFPIEPLVFIRVSSEAQELDEPVQITLPVNSDDPLTGWPILIVLDLDSGTVEYLPNDLVYDPVNGTIEYSLDHFSGTGVGIAPDKDKQKKCNDPGGACRCGRIYVKSSFHDYSIGDCQSVSDEVSVQFLDCPGQPTETHKMSEIAGDCIAMGSLAFQASVAVEGMDIIMTCGDPIPFIIGGSNNILGGGPMQCVINENFEGLNLEMLIDEQISLTGKFDGVNLNFDPPKAGNISGYMKAWSMLEGEEFIIIDMVFDDETASADAGVFRGMTMMRFSTPTDSSGIDKAQFAFSIPLDTSGQAEIVIQDEGATAILTITMELDY